MGESDSGYHHSGIPRPLAAFLVLELLTLACQSEVTAVATLPPATATQTWEVVGIPYAHATDQADIQRAVSDRARQKELERKLPERFPDGIMQLNFGGKIESGVGGGVFVDLGFTKIVEPDNTIGDYLLGKIVTVAHNVEKTYGGPIDQTSTLRIRSMREANPDELNHEYHDVIPVEWQYVPGTNNTLAYLTFAVRLTDIKDTGWYPVDAGYFVDGNTWLANETAEIVGFPAGVGGIPYLTEGPVIGYETGQFVVRVHLINGDSGGPAIRQGKYIFGFVNANTDAIPERGVLTLNSPDIQTQMRDKDWISDAVTVLSGQGYSIMQ